MSGQRVKFEFKQGEGVRDKVTGFEGRVTAQYHFINGCIRYQVEAQVKEPGENPKYETIDEARLERVRGNNVNIEPADTGGPRPGPAARPAPRA